MVFMDCNKMATVLRVKTSCAPVGLLGLEFLSRMDPSPSRGSREMDRRCRMAGLAAGGTRVFTGAGVTVSAGRAPGENPEADDLLREDVLDEGSLLPALGTRGACMGGFFNNVTPLCSACAPMMPEANVVDVIAERTDLFC